MTISDKTTKAELIAMLADAEGRALGSYHELIEVRGKLNHAIANMGDNKPWKLAALAFVAGIVIGWLGNGVV